MNHGALPVLQAMDCLRRAFRISDPGPEALYSLQAPSGLGDDLAPRVGLPRAQLQAASAGVENLTDFTPFPGQDFAS